MRICQSGDVSRGRAWIVGWVSVLAFTLAMALATPALAANVSFHDAKLEVAVRSTLGIAAPQAITDTDMLELTNLVAINQGITDLDGLEYATNLGFIGMPNNEIADITPLAGLTRLSTVYLNGNRIKDISALCAIPGMYDVNLNDNRISAVPHIAWTGPYFLQMRNNRISDLSGFEGLGVRFESIDLSGNRIDDLTPLSSLLIGSPMTLNLNDNRITDLSPLIRSGYMTAFGLAVERNRLDLSAGSAAMGDITTLLDKQASVSYLPQK